MILTLVCSWIVMGGGYVIPTDAMTLEDAKWGVPMSRRSMEACDVFPTRRAAGLHMHQKLQGKNTQFYEIDTDKMSVKMVDSPTVTVTIDVKD